MLGSFLFIPLTSGLKSLFRNDALSDIIFSAALIALLYADFMVLTIFRPSSLRIVSIVYSAFEQRAFARQRQYYHCSYQL